MPDTGSPVSTLARERMKKLDEAAWSAYKDERLIRAAELFKQARAIAEDLNDNRKVIHYRFCAAAAISETGKLNSALQEILPTLQQDYREGDPADNTKFTFPYVRSENFNTINRIDGFQEFQPGNNKVTFPAGWLY
jgi:hypothetical protein